MAEERRHHGGEAFTRGEAIGMLGVGSALLAWIYALTRPAPVTIDDIVNVQCPPCDCEACRDR